MTTDLGVDACLVDREGREPVLLLRPQQTFGAAVAAVRAVLPSASPDHVRKLVRHHLPHVIDLDEVLFDGRMRHAPAVGYPYAATLAAFALALAGFALIVLEVSLDNPRVFDAATRGV